MPVTNYFWDPLQDNITKEYDDNGDTIVRYTTEPGLYGNVISQERDRTASPATTISMAKPAHSPSTFGKLGQSAQARRVHLPLVLRTILVIAISAP
jgi:hypothetical protein